MSNKSDESINKTWFVDIDGTIFYHKSNKELDMIIQDGLEESYLHEKPIPGAIEFFRGLPKRDQIVIVTAREDRHRMHTIRALTHYKMPYDVTLFNVESGPRVLVNDIKPPFTAGNIRHLDSAYAINVSRDAGVELPYEYNKMEQKIAQQTTDKDLEQKLIQE